MLTGRAEAPTPLAPNGEGGGVLLKEVVERALGRRSSVIRECFHEQNRERERSERQQNEQELMPIAVEELVGVMP